MSNGELNIPGYDLVRNYRTGQQGGGVAAYKNKRSSSVRRTDIDIGDTEVLLAELRLPRTKTYAYYNCIQAQAGRYGVL